MQCGYFHMQYLGDTLEEVATEKSGIIKKGCPVIVSDQKPEVINILEKKAREMNVPLVVADTRKVKDISFSLDKTCFSYPIDGEYREYQISLLGKHQIQNAVLAIEVARELGKLNIVSKSNPSIYSHSFSNNISEDSIGEGLYKARWHGRFEQISKNPDIYIDGAHNEEAALRLRDSIEIYFTNRRIIFMIGVLADKDYQSMLEILAPLAYTIITLTPDNNRGLSSHILASEARKYCDRVLDGGDLKHAIKLVYKEAKSDDIIIAFGSLSFLGSLAGDLNTKG